MTLKSSSTTKKFVTSTRCLGRLEFQGPRAPINAPTQYDLSNSSDEGGESQRLEETSSVPQIESAAEILAQIKGKKCRN